MVTHQSDSPSRMCVMVRLMRRPACCIALTCLLWDWRGSKEHPHVYTHISSSHTHVFTHTSTPLRASCGALS
jgi:hypothetical protein